ncbi:MAG: hypothetical protein IT270_16270 [Saprospiraceae bacterium]|nr:hypothetical protein [Saprospiraceae bacterium]
MPKLLTLLLLMFSLFSCFKKKSPAKSDFPSWLETHYPDKFTVLESGSNYDIMDYLKGKKQTWVAEKADPDVQFLMYWNKNADTLAITTAELQKEWDIARDNTRRARELYTMLKEAGLENVSAGASSNKGNILVFAEPTPEQREALAKILTQLRPKLRTAGFESVWTGIMEPSAYKYHFEDIIPAPHWRRAGGWQDNNLLFFAKWALQDPTPERFQYNNACDRNGAISDEAAVEAQAWAEKNLKKPFYLEKETGYSVGDDPSDPLKVVYEFPLYTAKPANNEDEPIGYVSVTYHVDKRTFTGIKQVKD